METSSTVICSTYLMVVVASSVALVVYTAAKTALAGSGRSSRKHSRWVDFLLLSRISVSWYAIVLGKEAASYE
jgi:hypothetical protein